MSNNDNIDEERNGLWFWIPLVLILLVLFFIIRSCSNDDQLWQSSAPDAASDAVNQTTDAVGDALNSAKSTAGGVISDAAKTATGAVGDMADSAKTAAGNAAATAGDGMSDLASGAANSVAGAGDVASGLAGSAMDATKSGGEEVTSAASDALGAAGSAMQATGDTAMDSAGKTAEMAKNAALTGADKVMNIPSGVLQGDVVNLLSSGKLVAGKHYPAGTLHFETSKSVVGKDDQAILDAITQIAKAHPSMTIHLHGHADSSGPDKFNQFVSTQRALGAKNLLINAGVNAQQIETHGHGSNKPVASNDTPQGRWKNRRTEIEIQR